MRAALFCARCSAYRRRKTCLLNDFISLGLPTILTDSLTAHGFTEPTKIQSQAIPKLLEGKDMMGIAQTGSGKTAAFGLPILAGILTLTGRPRPLTTRALILAPTRELAVQIDEAIRKFAGSKMKLDTVLLLGGVSRYHQVKRLEKGVDIVVATPGRLKDLMDDGKIRLNETRWLVLDEAHQVEDIACMFFGIRLSRAQMERMLREAAARLGGRIAVTVADDDYEIGEAVLVTTLQGEKIGAGDRLHDPQRRVITGGAPLTARTAANFEKASGARARPLYGTTEAGAIAVVRHDDSAKPGGCVGRPFDGVEVQIRRADDIDSESDMREFGPGVGLVHVRSKSVMAGYLNNETIDASPLPDGWFNTGDLGWIDADGALHLRGRRAEVINVSGMKVLPSEVEEVIGRMPGVIEVKVYAGRTRQGLHYVKAAVVAEEGIDVGLIKSHCQEHLVYFKRPGRIILMDALPRSSRGKILREQLP